MDKRIRKRAAAHDLERISLGKLIHQHVRLAIETAVHEELRAALGTNPYERTEVRRGYRNGTKVRTLTGPTGPAALTLARATLFAGAKEWTSRIVRVITGGCRRSMKPSSPRTWRAATPAEFAARSNHC